MPASATYDPLGTTTVTGSPAASYTFSSIPATYTDLVLVLTGTSNTGVNNIDLRFNGDSGSNYSTINLFTNGSTVSYGRDVNLSQLRYGGFDTTASMVTYDILSYANTTGFKRVLMRNFWTGGTGMATGMWRSTAAISSILVQLSSNSLAVGTRITLFGIRAA